MRSRHVNLRLNCVCNFCQSPIQGVIVVRAESEDNAVFRAAAATPVLRERGDGDAARIKFSTDVIGGEVTDDNGVKATFDGASFGIVNIVKNAVHGGTAATVNPA